MISIKGNFTVNGQPFAEWFNDYFLPKYKATLNLNRGHLNPDNFHHVFSNISKLTGKTQITLHEFIGYFFIIYNEVGGKFQSISELGSASYITGSGSGKLGYSVKERGRGLNQLTGASSYRVVLAKLGYNYDNLSSDDLDALFLKPDIYFSAFRIYNSDTRLAGSQVKKLEAGDFWTYGRTVACGYNNNCAYANLFKKRGDALKNELLQANVKNYVWNTQNKRILLVLLILALILGYMYRVQILAEVKRLKKLLKAKLK